ncbi:uncharacterized protein EAF02_004486 [Botrytis sinoallii]|uniref:uncharacterized protein n=1 Tax=Botrytis sinoallii TaxID=1463999 RepID=UPI0019024A93|nr:uncharacterized protein EAF02_004486 [Botrytis sinoallii]KAF7885977.1 hypothetical protein EAF02_004486 [Botrytis sinoallii]
MEKNGSGDAEIDTEDWQLIEMKLHDIEARRQFSKLSFPNGKNDETRIACDVKSRIVLSKMWKGTRDLFRAILEHNGVDNKDIEEEINAFFLDIDTYLIENIKLTHNSIRVRIESDLQAKNKKVNKTTAEVQTIWALKIQIRFKPRTIKRRAKTQTVAPTQAGNTVRAVPVVSAVEKVDATTQLQIKVDIKTLGILTSMYSNPDGDQDTGHCQLEGFQTRDA